MNRRILPAAIALSLTVILSFGRVTAQNLDLVNGKEFDDMAQLNPAFTGFLNELRLLTGASEELRAGLESKLFKTPNYLGFNFSMDEIDHLKRQSFRFNYARDKVIKENLTIKYAANLDYQVRTFHRSATDTAFTFSDFNGNTWDFDVNGPAFRVNTEAIDIGLGVAAVYNQLIFGLNVRHLGGVDVSLVEGGQSQTLPVEINAQLAGFLDLLGKVKLFPNVMYSQVGSESSFALGIGVNKEKWSFNGQYEEFDNGNGRSQRLDLGVFGRLDRFLVGLSYEHPFDPDVLTDGGLISDRLRLTLNTTLIQKKDKKLSKLQQNMRKYY